MPIVRDIAVKLEAGEILRRAGIKDGSRQKAQVDSVVKELVAAVKDRALLDPAAVYETWAVKELDRERLVLANDVVLQGPLLGPLLASADEYRAVVCTIGGKLENEVAALFKEEKPLQGYLLDEIGSAAVDSVAQEMCELITREVSARGLHAGSPLAPGERGFPLTEQHHLFELLPAEQIGVSLTAKGLMLPRKSTSMVMGIGPRIRAGKTGDVCARCNLGRTCRYRKRSQND